MISTSSFQECLCGCSFDNTGAFTRHKKTCSKGKKRLAHVLQHAKELYHRKKSHIGGGEKSLLQTAGSELASQSISDEAVRCHAPNRFGTVNMEDNVNIKWSWCEGWARWSLIVAIYHTRRLSWCKRRLPMVTVIYCTRTAKKQKKLKE